MVCIPIKNKSNDSKVITYSQFGLPDIKAFELEVKANNTKNKVISILFI